MERNLDVEMPMETNPIQAKLCENDSYGNWIKSELDIV
jgi:hypothetical protein